MSYIASLSSHGPVSLNPSAPVARKVAYFTAYERMGVIVSLYISSRRLESFFTHRFRLCL